MSRNQCSRRTALKSAIGFSTWAGLGAADFIGAAEPVAKTGRLETFVPCRRITPSGAHHWFGYYDKDEFDPSGRLVLANRVRFEGRSPTEEDRIEVGYIDTEAHDRWVSLGMSQAWGWQQGCMLQFIGREGSRILWNDREEDRFVCRIFDRATRQIRTLDRPVYTVSRDGRWGLSADFRRIDNLRPGYGYDGLADPQVRQRAPDESGIWRIDLETGASRLILSLADVAKLPWPDGSTHADAWHYFNHLLINPSATRFIVLHRYRPAFDPDTLQFKGGFVTRMLTANMEGEDLCVLDPSGHTSHFIWKDDRTVTMWTRPAARPTGFYDFVDQTDSVLPIGHDQMPTNGHNTYLPGDHGDWILNDTYPDRQTRRQTVYLYHVPSQRRFNLGRFPSPTRYSGEWRCDTHPRSSRDGNLVAIDSPHNEGRQVHVLDVSDLLQRES
ncbi:MAG: hypothetical protein AAGD07_01725 [Planctomycetota bacterium]